MNDFNKEDISLAEQDVDFDEMEQDIEQFAQDPSVREVLSVGVDLQNYGSEIQRQLKVVENESIEDYLHQVPYMKQLHEEIDQIDRNLETIENSLSQFKGSLGQLSSDICTLQTRSQAITIKLTNRKNLEQYLGQYARDISLSREFINQIVNGVVDSRYATCLQQLNRKLELVKGFSSNNSPYQNRQRTSMTHSNSSTMENFASSYAAAKEVRIPLDRLRLKASENIRNWLVARINHLRDYYGTDQVAVQNDLLKSKYLFTFLKKNAPDIESSMREYYVAIMSRIYLENFKVIAKMVYKRMNPISTMNEMIVPIVQKQSFFSTKQTISSSTLFFELGEDRHRLLHDILSPPQPFGDDVHYPVEALVRSLYQTLIDTITAEISFSRDFFEDPNIGMPIFSATSRFMEGFINDLVNKINDPVAMVLFFRFSIAHKKEMDSRKISLLDAHFNSIQQKVTSRFKTLLYSNRNAVDNCSTDLFVGPAQNSAHLANIMTKRFAEFALSIAIINDNDTDDLTRQEVQMLSQSIIKMLEKIGKVLSDISKAKNEDGEEIELVFLINNYFHIVSTLRESIGSNTNNNSNPNINSPATSPVRSKSISTLSNSEKNIPFSQKVRYMRSNGDFLINNNVSVVLPVFEQYLNDTNNIYIENLLKKHFNQLVNIVIEAFEKITNEQPRKVDFDLSQLEEIANDFKSKHNNKMKTIIETQLSNFGDYLNGKEIMKQIAKRLAVYWAKFYQLCSIVPKKGKSPQWISTMPTVGILVNEIQSITEKL
ncbi:Vacuolar protein sorting-associated protein 52 [Tritrichomonas musculus]|uniref:Vacuolar protein sorting-associated protein 52 n=1 Tax=Tritrichomonas musculus TaxID=1915356 RepID=A0ABR2KQ44_9EUKA